MRTTTWIKWALSCGLRAGSGRIAWCFAVLESHEVYAGKDPYRPGWIVELTKERGLEVDDKGKTIKPPSFEELRDGIESDLLGCG